GGARYGFDLREVKEVTTETTLTRVPQAPPAVRGYVNLRGQIHLVLDLRQLLELPPADVGPESRLVILHPVAGDSLGVGVARVGDALTVSEAGIQETPAGDPRAAGGLPAGSPALGKDGRRLRARDLISGVGKQEGELVTLLRARQLLPLVQQQMASS